MKTIPWKKLAIGAVAVTIVLAVIFYMVGGRAGEPVPSYINPAFAEYISSYTAGVQSSASPVRIVLAKEAVDSSMIGQESSVKLVSLSPSVSGKTFWIDRRTLEFRPDGRLTSGQVYGVSFKLGKLITVAEDLHVFSFNFQVIPQNFEISVDNIKPYIKTELKRQKIEGVLHTADIAGNEDVEKTMSAQQKGKSLKVTWTHGGDGKQHNFIVEDVAREDEATNVSLNVTGSAIGVDRTQEENVEVPALGDFKLMASKVVQNPNQYAILQFSDPLKEKQDLNGLIRITEASGLDFEIHDNEIWVYPASRLAGTKTVTIEAGVRNILDYKMKNAATAEIVFEQLKPEVRFTGKGTILPSTDGLILPFEAVNLKKVDVAITKIFEQNILQFLQVNTVGGDYEMHRVGKRILTKTVSLENTGVTDAGKWNRYTLDLAKLISTEPGAIYQVQISFKKAYSSYTCDESETGEDTNVEEEEDFPSQYEGEYYYDYEGDYYYEDYDWEQRDNPCHSTYYRSNRNIKKNVLASDLGLIAKRGEDGNTLVVATDLKTAQPLSGVIIELYSYQQELMGSATTDAEGKAMISLKEPAFAVIAKSGPQRGYLKLQDGEVLSVSQFDVSGDIVQKGLKGMLYGERGVWRPGDSLYLTFVLEDKNKTLPASHPVCYPEWIL